MARHMIYTAYSNHFYIIILREQMQLDTLVSTFNICYNDDILCTHTMTSLRTSTQSIPVMPCTISASRHMRVEMISSVHLTSQVSALFR